MYRTEIMKLHLKNRQLKPIKKRALKKMKKAIAIAGAKAWDFLK